MSTLFATIDSMPQPMRKFTALTEDIEVSYHGHHQVFDRILRILQTPYDLTREPSRASQEIELPAALAARLPSAIRRAKRRTYMDCTIFAHHLNGIGLKKNMFGRVSLQEFWDISPEAPNLSSLQPGNTLVLWQDNDYVHWMVSCGNDTVIHKLGSEGPVVLSSPDEAAYLFDADGVQIFTPKEQS